MATYFEIPLTPEPQTFSIVLGGNTYRVSLIWRENEQAGWVMDLADINNVPLVCGIPLVTGQNLLMQYSYLGFGGAMAVISDGDPFVVPTRDTLGVSSRLYFITRP